MSNRSESLTELRSARNQATNRLAVVGLDGFVDTIVTPVSMRHGQGENFEPITTIKEFGERILGAAGKSTNIEFYPRMDKLGGNGPIMANALLAQGTALKYVGALGQVAIHPVFQDLANRADVVSLCDPAATTAVEFTDGKIMLGQMKSLDEVTYSRIIEIIGEAGVRQMFSAADLVALVNWTMIPNMTGIFRSLLAEVIPTLPAKPGRQFFFDLADPEKRSNEDLLEALDVIAGFGVAGEVTLGVNLKEAQHVHEALGFGNMAVDSNGLKAAAAVIREHLGYACVVIHPKESAACATADGSYWVDGPYAARPLITTGAGDHFNAGFSSGRLLGLSPTGCLNLGVATSGHYVRTGQSPCLDDIEAFFSNWSD